MKIFFFIVLINIPSITYSQELDLTKAPQSPPEMIKIENFIKDNAPSENAFIALQRLVEQSIKERQWTKAKDIFQKFRPLFQTMEEKFDKIIILLMEKEEGLIIKNLGPFINTDSNEYLPRITNNGQRLYFCSDNPTKGSSGEDIFYSDFINGEWQRAQLMDKTFNSTDNDALLAISPDENRVILYRDYGNTYGDLYYIDKKKEGWSKIMHFPEPINTPHFEADAFLTADGKYILFVSDRPCGIGYFVEKGSYFHGSNSGNTDIYVCQVLGDSIGEPINLGPVINTPYCERTPFLCPDGKTLYFSSDGHYGFGRLDIFKATRLNDSSWTYWSEPINLGKEINTSGNDWGFQLTPDGVTAYFSSKDRSNGYGCEDIFSAKLPYKYYPKSAAKIYGKVMDSKGNPIFADLRWKNLSTDLGLIQSKSDPDDGIYFMTLPLGIQYQYYVEKPGYYPMKNNIDLREEKCSKFFREDIILQSLDDLLEKESFTKINNILFETNKRDPASESYTELDRLANLLLKYPLLKIEISGHTDNQGSYEYNFKLSQERAQSIARYLHSKRCSNENFILIGYADTKPSVPNNSDENRAKNRRVEFKFLK